MNSSRARLEPRENVAVDGLDALLAAGRRLRELDPRRFESVLALLRGYVAIYDRPDEPEEVFMSRVAQAMSDDEREFS